MNYVFLICVWMALFACMAKVCGRVSTPPPLLCLCYIVGTSLIYLPGALVRLSPEWAFDDNNDTAVGLTVAALGLAFFIGGASLAFISGIKPSARPLAVEGKPVSGSQMVAIGVLIFLIFIPISSVVPSIASLITPFLALIPLGGVSLIYESLRRKNNYKLALGAITVLIVPAITMTAGGFLGYGIYWVIPSVLLLWSVIRPRVILWALAPAFTFLLVSLAVSYFAQRGALRDVVWERDSGIQNKLSAASEIWENFIWFDYQDPQHLLSLDNRLNQGFLVGQGVRRHQGGRTELFYGGTVPWWWFVPRAFWPDKPAVGGGRGLVSDFCGIVFAPGTSVGAGQVLEFYANFGYLGLVFGFLAFGFLVGWLDLRLNYALQFNASADIVKFGVPGFCLLQPGGNLLEIITGIAGAIFVLAVIARVKEVLCRRKRVA